MTRALSQQSATGAREQRGNTRAVLISGAFLLVLLDSTWFSATAVIGQAYPVWHIGQSNSAWLTVGVQWGFAGAAVIASILRITDVLSPPRLILICSAGAAVANLSLLYIHSPGSAIIARVLTGAFAAGIYPPWVKLISTWYRAGRGMAVGVLVGALSVGQGLPYLVNALGGLNWHTVIVVTSIATILGGVVTRVFIPEGPYQFSQGRFDIRQVGRILRDKKTRLVAFGYIGHMWELYAALTWFLPFASYAMLQYGVHNPVVPLYMTFAVFVIGGVATWTCGILGDRLGREEVAIAMMALSATCSLLIGPATALPWLVLAAVAIIWGYSIIGDSVQFSVLATEYAPSDSVGTALTLQMAAGFALSGFTIWLIPIIQSAVGWRWTFAVLAAGPLAGLTAMRRNIRIRGAE